MRNETGGDDMARIEDRHSFHKPAYAAAIYPQTETVLRATLNVQAFARGGYSAEFMLNEIAKAQAALKVLADVIAE